MSQRSRKTTVDFSSTDVDFDRMNTHEILTREAERALTTTIDNYRRQLLRVCTHQGILEKIETMVTDTIDRNTPAHQIFRKKEELDEASDMINQRDTLRLLIDSSRLGISRAIELQDEGLLQDARIARIAAAEIVESMEVRPGVIQNLLREGAQSGRASEIGDVSSIENVHRQEQNQSLREIGQAHRLYVGKSQELANHNMRLVTSITKKYTGKGVDTGDLLNEGAAGLMIAVERFDIHRGTKFSTYATGWIKNHILDALHRMAGFMRVPSEEYSMTQSVIRTKARLMHALGREVSVAEIAQVIGKQSEEVRTALRNYQDPVRIADLETDFFPSRMETANAEEEAKAERTMKIVQLMSVLLPLEKQIIELRYGITDGKPKTPTETARILEQGFTSIRNAEERAMRKMKMAAKKTSSDSNYLQPAALA